MVGVINTDSFNRKLTLSRIEFERRENDEENAGGTVEAVDSRVKGTNFTFNFAECFSYKCH